jgi:hypothetical protein
MSAPDLYIAEITPDEATAGFAVQPIEHPDGPPAGVPVAVHGWGDPAHRLIKTRGRDGVVFQLQAFGRRRSGAGPVGWFAERYWPGRYGIGWVLDRLREHVGRPGYRALIDLHVPPAGYDAVPDNPASTPLAPPV